LGGILSTMTKEEIDCEDPKNEDHPDCECGYADDDGYDRWSDDRLDRLWDIKKEREMLYKKLLLCETHGNHNDERDELEKKLVKNLTGSSKHWLDMNSVHGDWV